MVIKSAFDAERSIVINELAYNVMCGIISESTAGK